MLDLLDDLATLRQGGGRAVLATVVAAQGSTPRKAGARLLVLADGTLRGTVGGGAVERHVIDLAQALLPGGEATLVTIDLTVDLGMACGGRMTVFLEPVGDAAPLLLFGAGHIGLEVCDLASRCGFAVTVVDARDALRTPERFPRAARLRADADAAGMAALLGAGRADETYVIIATHAHGLDRDLAAAALPLGPRYLGVIGSQRKSATLREHLRTQGADAAAVARLRCPMGLPIGGQTPVEIALSIVAELVAERSRPTP
jgi:xanthine dehydrogenase accessory factor